MINKPIENEQLLAKKRREIAEKVNCKECNSITLCNNDFLNCINIKENRTIGKWFKKFNTEKKIEIKEKKLKKNNKIKMRCI